MLSLAGRLCQCLGNASFFGYCSQNFWGICGLKKNRQIVNSLKKERNQRQCKLH